MWIFNPSCTGVKNQKGKKKKNNKAKNELTVLVAINWKKSGTANLFTKKLEQN